MKKVLSRILAIALAIVLFSAPSTAQAASTTSTPTLIVFTDNLKYYDYRPDSYDLGTSSIVLTDLFGSNGDWVVPAFSRLSFSIDFQTSTKYRITVVKMGTYSSDIIMNNVYTGGVGVNFSLPVYDTDTVYRIILSGDTPGTTVYGYCAKLS